MPIIRVGDSSAHHPEYIVMLFKLICDMNVGFVLQFKFQCFIERQYESMNRRQFARFIRELATFIRYDYENKIFDYVHVDGVCCDDGPERVVISATLAKNFMIRGSRYRMLSAPLPQVLWPVQNADEKYGKDNQQTCIQYVDI